MADGTARLPEIAAASVPTPPTGKLFIFVDSADKHIKSKDDAGTVTDLTIGGLVSSVFGRVGAVVAVAGDYDGSEVTYTPVDLTDWNGSVDPGDVDDALDQLVDRVKAVEASTAVFGQDYQSAESAGLSTTGSTAFQTKVSLSTPALTGTYRVGWRALASSTPRRVLIEYRLRNTTDALTLGGTIFEKTDENDQQIPIGGFANVVFTGAAKTFAIEFHSDGGNGGLDEAEIQEALIEFWRVA